MSFFTLSDGTQATSINGKTEEVATGFENIPAGSIVIGKANEAKWDNYNGVDTIKIKWQIVGKEYTGRILFQKLAVEDLDPKKRDRAINMLMAIDFNAQKTLAQSTAKPTNESLASFIGKPMGLFLDEWEMKNEAGEVKTGNWINMISDVQTAGKILQERGGNPKAKPKAPVQQAMQQTAPATSPTVAVSDEIPF